MMNACSNRLRPVRVVRIVRALRYPSYQRLAIQRALFPMFGSVLMGLGSLSSLAVGALHGSDGVTMMGAHLITHIAIVAPIAQKKALHS
jgi:hypothetical protein